MPKIAITGKGGVGKTTLAALLAHIYAQAGRPVIGFLSANSRAVEADMRGEAIFDAAPPYLG
jgi:nucleoside-triphosphatase THEP1